MIIHHLMALAPGRIKLNGTEYNFYGGQCIRMPHDDYEVLINGPYRGRLNAYYQEEIPDTVLPPVERNMEFEVEPELALPVDPIGDELAHEGSESLELKLEIPPELQKPPELPKRNVQHLIPFDEHTHWQKVKTYVLDLEEQIPVDYELIEAVGLKFHAYPSVVKECDRILGEKPKDF